MSSCQGSSSKNQAGQPPSSPTPPHLLKKIVQRLANAPMKGLMALPREGGQRCEEHSSSGSSSSAFRTVQHLQHQLLEESSTDNSENDGSAGETPCKGSGEHPNGSGSCDPCVFYCSSLGCKDGDACKYCHHPLEERQAVQRPRKPLREKLKARIEQLLQNRRPDEVQEELQAEARKSPYARKLLQGYVLGLTHPVPRSKESKCSSTKGSHMPTSVEL
ncbi:unnamed protein product [Effrenium voratum]|nr:unnamed protein product [Effrenium voratum]